MVEIKDVFVLLRETTSSCAGDRRAALSLETLSSHGITHVLNMAQGQGSNRVDTDATFYSDAGIVFKGIEAEDASFYDIAAHFEETSEFIEKSLLSNGRVMVHCREGYSRAPTVVCAYFMMKRRMRLMDALKMINDQRKICPNVGFLEQLIEFDEELAKDRAKP